MLVSKGHEAGPPRHPGHAACEATGRANERSSPGVPSTVSQITPYILVVEEVQTLQLALLSALRHRGVEARGVASCDDVVRLLEASVPPRALLVSCPGEAHCQRRRGDPRYASLADVPVVAMTATSHDSDCHCIRASLAKPFGVGRLVATLLQACTA